MVTINQQVVTITKSDIVPLMYQHSLATKKDAGNFKQGTNYLCFVARYDNNRFAVWETTYTRLSIYRVFTEQDLHDTFDES